jgi:NAD(P)-dependent dehydrogenase (short-subunit alcohol dehydrogenase family)
MPDGGTRGIRSFQGAVAIVTGGASGIGAALGRELARQGARVILADRQLELASEVARAINDAGGKAEAVELDVRDAIAFDAIVALTIERHGRLDYLFNNAGIAIGGEIREYRLDDWRDVVDVNLMGVVHGVQASYGRMIAQGFGHIVNTASVAGLLPCPFMGSYTTTKHAVVGLSKSLRAEAARHGVRASMLCPGVIRTPILTGGRFGRMTQPIDLEVAMKMWEGLSPIEPDDFARRALRAVAANRGTIFAPGWWRVVCWLNGTASSLFERGVAAGVGRLMKQVTRSGPGPTRPATAGTRESRDHRAGS